MQERRVHAPTADHSELDGLVRHVALADWLVLIVVVLYVAVSPVRAALLPLGAAVAVFAAVSVLLRLPRLTVLAPLLRLELEAWAMIGFITAVAALTGGADSPLESLYLLPVVLAALVLPGPRITLALAGTVLAYLALALRGPPAVPAALVGRALVVLGPLVIAAWLTAQLGSAVLSARRRAAALTDGDALTGLATRRVFIDSLKRELADAGARPDACAVLMLDLEGTRRLNELYGNEAGNQALRLVAEVLRRTLRETDLAARAGGDEFAVLLVGAGQTAAQSAAQRIRHAMHTATLEAGSRMLRCQVSIGIAVAPRDGREAAPLVACAERRLAQDRELRRAATGSAAVGA